MTSAAKEKFTAVNEVSFPYFALFFLILSFQSYQYLTNKIYLFSIVLLGTYYGSDT
jgi:hypothetical protein